MNKKSGTHPLIQRHNKLVEDIRAIELPEDQKEVFLMREEGASFPEVAEGLGMTVNMAKKRMKAAIDRLSSQLGELKKEIT